MPEGITANKLHDYWLDKINRAYRRLNRARKETEWAKWARLADYDRYDRLNFTEPARRDLKLDIVGERPAIRIQAQRAREASVEDALTRLCELELDNRHNWSAVKRVVGDAGLAGVGWLKADWFSTATTPETSDEDEASQVALARQHQSALLAGQEAVVSESDNHAVHVAVEEAALNVFGLTSEQKQRIESHVDEHKAFIAPLAPSGFRLSRIHPSNILFDDTADEWRYCEWVAERSVERLEDVQTNPQFKHTANLRGQSEIRRRGYRRRGKRLDTNVGSPVDTASRSSGLLGQEDQYVVLWYIHDMREDRLIVVAQDNPDHMPLKDDVWPYDGTVYYPLVFEPEADGIEGVSDYKRLLYPCEQRATIQERWLAHLDQHSRRKILAQPGFVGPEGQAAICDPNKTMVPVENLALYAVMADVPINKDAYNIDGAMKENIARAIGVGEPQQGVAGQTSSATEANLLESSRGRVVKDRRQCVGDMLKWVVGRILNYYKRFGTQSMFLERGVGTEADLVLDPDDITEMVRITVDNDALSATHAELDRQLTRQAVEVINSSPWMIQILGTQGRIQIASKFIRSQKLLADPDTTIKQGVAEMIATGQMLPSDASARTVTGPAATGTPGQQTGNIQTGLASGPAAPGQQQAGGA